MSSRQTDACVLDLVQSKTLDLDRDLVAQIRERIVALDQRNAARLVAPEAPAAPAAPAGSLSAATA